MSTFNEIWKHGDCIAGGINAADRYGKTILHYACGNYTAPVIQELLDVGANVNARDIIDNTPLHHAVRRHNTEVVALLLRNGANPSAANAQGCTPLHEAADQQHEPIGRLLLDAGADMNARDRRGASPIYCAAKARCDKLTYLLVTRGCEIHLEEKLADDRTILHLTYMFCKNGAFIRRAGVQQRQHRKLVDLALLLKPLDLPVLVVHSIFCSEAGRRFVDTMSQYAAWKIVKEIKHQD